MNALPATPGQMPAVLDLRGRPLRDLRLSLIEACNFRCGYCMPAEQVPDDYGFDTAQRLSFAEIETLVRSFARVGVHKLRLTGGEPLLRRNIATLVGRLARIPGIDDLAMTTNASLLARHAQALRDAGLHRLTISLDTLNPELFHTLSGRRGHLDAVLAGIQAAEAAGFGPLKFNCVVQRGVNDGEVLALVEFARAGGHVMRFIEYMDVGTCNGWNADSVVPSSTLRDTIAARWPLRPLDPNYRGEVADRYGFVDGQGEVGFVSSVTAPFCGDCHRARVSADGQLYTCLFASSGMPLRPWLSKGDMVLGEHLAALWQRRGDHYSEQRGSAASGRGRVEMFLIGG